jgi:hypothetical protein
MESGQPATGVPVEVLRPSNNAMGRELISVGMTTANDRGDYRIYGIAPGRYYVLAGNDMESRRPVIAGQVLINVLSADIDNVRLVISPGATIPARLRVEGQAPVDLSRFVIELALVPHGVGFSGFFTETPPISPEGAFNFTGIHDGDYQLQVNRLPSGLRASRMRDKTR